MLSKIFSYIFKVLFAFLFVLFMLPFLVSPIYQFPEYKPFDGKNWYNPYQNVDNNHWKKANFQIQSLAWGGITDGQNNPTDLIVSRYSKLKYDVIGISDYQKINTFLKGKKGYVPIYEHGFNMSKTHQVSLGARKVFWLDFPFYQNVHHKQFIINCLKKRADILLLAHPNFSLEGYSKDDLSKLVNYDLIEALNHQKFSLQHWDAALSAGRLAWLVADDDAHNLNNPYLYGVVVTFINSKSVATADIFEGLTTGKAYGYLPTIGNDETFEKKLSRVNDFNLLKSVRLNGDTLTVKAGIGEANYLFIGQNSDTLESVNAFDSCSYILKSKDHYVRTEISFPDGSKIFLNPVVRSNGENIIHSQAKIVLWKSILSILIAWFSTIWVLWMIFLKRKK